MLASGTVLRNRYEIRAKVGQGGMAMVYRARDLHFEARDVAVKQMAVLVRSLADRQDVVAQFKAEANILTRLAHPNIPRVIDLFQEGDDHFLVMEFVEGQTLDRLSAPCGEGPTARPPVATILGWGLQVAEALTYLHGQSPQAVVYKDLKPQNLILTPEGRVMLLDFGLAKAPDRNGVSRTIIKGAGTPGFAAPEQYTPGASDPRVDLYALGATLHALLTGSVPTDAFRRNEELKGGAPDPLQPPSSANRAVSPEVDTFLARLMALQPDDRPPSAREVVQELEKLLDAPAGRQVPPAKVDACRTTAVPGTRDSPPAPATQVEAGGCPHTAAPEPDAAARDRVPVPATQVETADRRDRAPVPATQVEAADRRDRAPVPATQVEAADRSDGGTPDTAVDPAGARPAHGPADDPPPPRSRHPARDVGRSRAGLAAALVLGGALVAAIAWGKASSSPPSPTPIPSVSPSSASVPAAGVPIPTPTVFTPESPG